VESKARCVIGKSFASARRRDGVPGSSTEIRDPARRPPAMTGCKSTPGMQAFSVGCRPSLPVGAGRFSKLCRPARL
jgi:hypothetical protein